ncbi:hypothetical protein RclHR1_03520019 [Rhizophagus clarus]|uniref:Uncharacterized protein n=1 Tax=Rhizophagus clarus TaxID=94130 RepID=A0A2Z6RR15_9GLOM|nr:hypothetical protein RclHR1_03520019 [Rhizophagus clarus]GET04861.1 hypothetical protein GLOIN_2v1690042 [Rhizophagus clarus]
MTSLTSYFNKHFSPENYSQRGYGDSFHKLQVANTLGYSEKKLLNSDENVREQVNISVGLNSNNYVHCNVNQSKGFRENISTKEIESKVISTLESELRKLSIRNGNGNSVGDESYNISLEKNNPTILSDLCHPRFNSAQNTRHDSFIQELTFDSLPDDALITIKQTKPIHNIALFISFNYDLNNHFFQEECNAHGFHALFHDVKDHINIVPIAKLITDVVINCWSRDWNIIVFFSSEPILPISAVTALLKLLRAYFDQKILDIVIIWPNVHEGTRPWIDEQCRVAKATACIQGVKVSDIVPQIMSYFDNGDCSKEINGTTTLFGEKKITICYHEFNNSHPAAMRIDDKIWLDVKRYFTIMKGEIEQASLTENNSHDGNILLENILRKALYNKFSQHSPLKYMLLSTRIASIYFTQEICQCNVYSDSKDIAKSDTDILKAKFTSILEEVRYNLMQEERKRIESEKYRNLMNREKNLFLL